MLAVTKTSRSLQQDRTTQGRDDALGHFGGVSLGRDVLEQNGELVAAQAGDGVLGAHAASNARGHLGQQGVALLVAQAVVDDFEVVDVQEQHADRAEVAVGVSQSLFESVGEQGPIGQPRQWIVKGQLFELLLELLALGDVAIRHHDARDRRLLEQVVGDHLAYPAFDAKQQRARRPRGLTPSAVGQPLEVVARTMRSPRPVFSRSSRSPGKATPSPVAHCRPARAG